MAISIRQQTGLAWSLALLPFGAIGMLHVNVPYHDQWDLLPLLDAYYQNRLTLTDFLAPHNGHILLFPQLLMLGLALLTQWHTGAEVLVSLLLTCLNYALLLRLLLPNHASTSAPLLRIGLSLLAFSFAQAENWIWGWQLQVPLCLSAVLAGIKTVTMNAGISGTWDNFDININSNLGSELSQGFQKELMGKVGDAQAKLRSFVDEKIGGDKKAMGENLSALSSGPGKSMGEKKEALEKLVKNLQEKLKGAQAGGLQEKGKNILKGFGF